MPHSVTVLSLTSLLFFILSLIGIFDLNVVIGIFGLGTGYLLIDWNDYAKAYIIALLTAIKIII